MVFIFNIIHYRFDYLNKSHSKTTSISISRSKASEETEDLKLLLKDNQKLCVFEINDIFIKINYNSVFG